MPLLPTNFDANAFPERENFGLIPPGDYKAAIVASEERKSKNGDPYVSLEFDILDGDARGRKLWVNLNLAHPNPTVAAIASQTLAEICRAVGVLHPKRTEDLHGLPMIVTVRIKRQKDGVDRNVITRFATTAANASAAIASPNTQAPVPPWRVKR